MSLPTLRSLFTYAHANFVGDATLKRSWFWLYGAKTVTVAMASCACRLTERNHTYSRIELWRRWYWYWFEGRVESQTLKKTEHSNFKMARKYSLGKWYKRLRCLGGMSLPMEGKFICLRSKIMKPYFIFHRREIECKIRSYKYTTI